MNIKEYQDLAMRTNDGKCTERLNVEIEKGQGIVDVGGIINACLGLAGEVGEVNDMIKKTIFHRHQIEGEDIKKEISDCMWYIALMCESFGFNMNEIAEINIEKLKKRYPDGFSEKASINRVE